MGVVDNVLSLIVNQVGVSEDIIRNCNHVVGHRIDVIRDGYDVFRLIPDQIRVGVYVIRNRHDVVGDIVDVMGVMDDVFGRHVDHTIINRNPAISTVIALCEQGQLARCAEP